MIDSNSDAVLCDGGIDTIAVVTLVALLGREVALTGVDTLGLAVTMLRLDLDVRL